MPNLIVWLTSRRPVFRGSRPTHPHRPFAAFLVQLHLKRQRLADGGWPPIAREGGHVHEELLIAMVGHHEAKAPLSVPFLERAVESGGGGVHGCCWWCGACVAGEPLVLAFRMWLCTGCAARAWKPACAAQAGHLRRGCSCEALRPGQRPSRPPAGLRSTTWRPGWRAPGRAR